MTMSPCEGVLRKVKICEHCAEGRLGRTEKLHLDRKFVWYDLAIIRRLKRYSGEKL